MTSARRRTAVRAPIVIIVLVVALTAFSPPAVAGAADATHPNRAARRCPVERLTGPGRGAAEACPGVRPGAIVTSGGEQCTLDFVFRGRDGRTYAGTAGHCTLDAPGETTFGASAAPAAFDGRGRRIGTFAYAVLERPFDFALIRLDRGVRWDPEMCHFGGPTGVYSGRSGDPQVVHHFGHGQVVGREAVTGQATFPARSAVARDTQGALEVFAHGVASPGDSGSPVIVDDGRALGILIGIGTGDLVILRLGPLLGRAERVMGTDLRLVTPRS